MCDVWKQLTVTGSWDNGTLFVFADVLIAFVEVMRWGERKEEEGIQWRKMKNLVKEGRTRGKKEYVMQAVSNCIYMSESLQQWNGCCSDTFRESLKTKKMLFNNGIFGYENRQPCTGVCRWHCWWAAKEWVCFWRRSARRDGVKRCQRHLAPVWVRQCREMSLFCITEIVDARRDYGSVVMLVGRRRELMFVRLLFSSLRIKQLSACTGLKIFFRPSSPTVS